MLFYTWGCQGKLPVSCITRFKLFFTYFVVRSCTDLLGRTWTKCHF